MAKKNQKISSNKVKKTKDELFNDIIIDISEKGMSCISALKGRMSSQTFYILLQDEEKSKQYARATEMRADRMAEEILELADNFEHDIMKTSDGREVTDHAVVNRDRLRVDSRKWLLSKLHPKKYGDKVDVTSGDLPINTGITIELIDSSDKIEHEEENSGSK
jgi:hypothetical protein